MQNFCGLVRRGNFFEKGKIMEYKTIEDLGDLNGKVVMLRADLNVPMDENFHVTNTARIDRTVPTIRLLMNKGAKVVVVSHFGRPEGKGDMKNSLSHIVSELEKLWANTLSLLMTASARKLKKQSSLCATTRYCCWKICAFIMKRKRRRKICRRTG